MRHKGARATRQSDTRLAGDADGGEDPGLSRKRGGGGAGGGH